MIRVRGLSYKIGKSLILNNINLDINAGDKIILVGKNGSGKSTLIRILTRAIPNQIFKNTFKTSFYLADNYYLPKNSYARSYLLRLQRLYNSTIDIDYLLDYFSLENKRIKALSKGNRQKLAIILGLISNSEIIYYDEALDGLDNLTREKLINYLNKIDNTVVIVTHYENLFIDSGFKKIVISKGMIVNEG